MKKLVITTALASMLLAGCSVSESAGNRTEGVNGVVDAGLSRLGDRKSVRAGGSQFSDGIFVGAAAERSSAALLPNRLQQSGAVRLESRDALTLDQISQRLSEITGIPHVLALGPTGQLTTVQSDAKSADEASPQSNERDAGGIPARRGAPKPEAKKEMTIRPNLRGTLSEVLDQVTSPFEVEWTYADGRVIFRDYVTRKYQISALPGATEATSEIGANSISSSSSLQSDVWTEVETALGSMVSDGASISLGSSTGLVTVTAKISDQNRVAEYIKEINGVVGQQVSFDVNVFTVNLDDEDSAGVDLVAALNGKHGSLNMTNTYGGSTAMGNVNIGVIKGDVSINAMIQALSTQGKVSVSTRAGTTTSNNRVAPINVIDKTAYLKEVSISENGDGDDRIERTTDTVETGFQMQLFPRVLNNREMMVQYTVRLSELNNLAVFGEGNEAVQLPEVSTTSFEQQAVLENGQTLVLAGFERQRAETTDTKSGGFLSLGGNKVAKTQKIATVMMITPRIISRK